MINRKWIVASLFFSFVLSFGGLLLAAAAANLTQPDSEVAILDTTFGQITLGFYPNAAPNHVKNFKSLARKGFYDGTRFHRVIPGFMIQGGDPLSKDNDRSNDGTGDAGYTIKAEFNDIKHTRGIVSMARSQDPNSASSQFFIMVHDYPSLDHQYSAFGYVISGIEVVDKIVKVQRDRNDNPLVPVVVKKVTIEKATAAQTATTTPQQ